MSEDTPEQTGEDENGSGKRLTDAQWKEIRDKFELGQARGGKLAQEYGVSAMAISKHFRKHGVVFGSRAHELNAPKASAPVATQTFAEKRDKRIEDTKEQAYQGAQALHLAMMKIMKESMTPGGSSFSTHQNSVKTLRGLAAILKDTTEIRYKVLDADSHVDENDMPILPIEVLTDEEIEDMRNADLEDDGSEMEAPDMSSILESDGDEVVEEG
jgi:hypothetical protein